MKLTAHQKESFYIIGICGVATGSVAMLLKELGHMVKGSDHNIYPPMSEVLQSNGIDILPGYKAANLEGFTGTVIIGNALSRDNPEVEAVLDKGLRFVSWPEVIREAFLWHQKALVVTGTHGKTTTTTMLSWILDQSGCAPSFLIGGVPHNFPLGYRYQPQAEYFVLEGDEYDTAFFDKRSKFLHYLPKGLIINNIEYDHADIFADITAIELSFSRLLRVLPRQAPLIANGDDQRVRGVVAQGWTAPQFFGHGHHVHWQICDEHCEQGLTVFTLYHRQSGQKQEFRLHTTGAHNVMNATAAVALAASVGVSLPQAARALATFKGVRRRMEKIVDTGELEIYDDFAKHPSNVKATLENLRTLYPRNRIWAIFEPRTNTTVRNVFQQELFEAFAPADRVVLGRVYRAQRYAAHERLDTQRLINQLIAAGKEASQIEDVNEIIECIRQEGRQGDKIVIMSNGSFDGLTALCRQAFALQASAV